MAASSSSTEVLAELVNCRRARRSAVVMGGCLEVLELMAARKDPITVSQLARELHIPKATTNLLVQHLVARRYINVSARRALTIGPQFLRLRPHHRRAFNSRSSARQVLQEIGHASGLDTYLGMITEHERDLRGQGGRPRNWVPVNVRLGIGRPLHCTAVGKLGPRVQARRSCGTRSMLTPWSGTPTGRSSPRADYCEPTSRAGVRVSASSSRARSL